MVEIVARLGSGGLTDRLAPMVPDDKVVDWPASGEVLITFDGLWDRSDRIPHEVRWVHVMGAGVGTFPLASLQGRPMTCSKGASSPAIAEFVLACMLAFAKRLPDTWISEPPPRWNAAQLAGLRGATLGIVGLGSIGTEVARRALGFEMRVVAVRRSGRPAELPGVSVTRDLAPVLSEADHLVIAAPETAATRHLLDREAFKLVKPGVHLVNIARGSLVDQEALIEALDDGRVAMASLDVVDPEPLPAGHPLDAHPRVRVSPHVSWSSPDTTPRMIEIFLENLRRYRAGEPLTGLVDVDAGY